MPRRIWKSKFKGYINALAIPLLVLSIVLIARPDILIPFTVERESAELYGGLPLIGVLLRFVGLGLAFPVLLLFVLKSRPNDLREIAFWQSIVFFIFAVYLFLGPFFFQMSMYVFIPAAYLTITSLFLLTFASKNLLVRE